MKDLCDEIAEGFDNENFTDLCPNEEVSGGLHRSVGPWISETVRRRLLSDSYERAELRHNAKISGLLLYNVTEWS